MVSAIWLLPAAMAGAVIGIGIIALCSVGKEKR
jgi:formate/nitrite transporter FocA (FNT family)